MNDTVKRRVLEIYADVDREVAAAGPLCIASGRCCRFKETGHVLYLSNLEADVLLDGAPPIPADAELDPAFCPYQKENLCTAREPRPLGCRVYYCDPTYQETATQITEKHLARLKALTDELGVPWRYAPLHHWLEQSCDPTTDTTTRPG